MVAAGVLAAVSLSSLFAAPGAFRTAIGRFLRPTAGLAPFTLVRFDVRIEPEKIYHGRSATITASLESSMKLPDHANVVFVDERRARDKPMPMLPLGEGRFALTIERLERSRRFFIDTPGGRSRLYELTVHPVPGFQRVHVRYEFPGYTQWPASSTVLVDRPDLRAIEGTRVTVTVHSDLPLQSGRLVVRPSAEGEPMAVALAPSK